MNEARIIGAVLSGDIEAYGVLVREYAPLLIGTARYLTSSMDDAEDLAQETLVDAYRNLKALRDHKAYKAWVFGILRHKCTDYLRRRKPEALDLDEYTESIAAPQPEDRSDLTELLSSLPLRDREVLAARYLQELDYKEIAEMLGVTKENARMRCSRARARLQKISEEQMCRAMSGAFMAVPMSDGFSGQVLQGIRQSRNATGAVSHSGGHFVLGGGLLKPAIGLSVLALAAGALLLLMGRPIDVSTSSQSAAEVTSTQPSGQSAWERSKNMGPKIITRGEMTLVGLVSTDTVKGSQYPDILGLWERFFERDKDIENKFDSTHYEVHRFLPNRVEVTVAVEVSKVGAVPEGMEVKRIPAGQYAIFTHRLANGGYEGLNPVMDKWLKTGPYQEAADFMVEVYDERFKEGKQPDSEIDFLIPIKPRA